MEFALLITHPQHLITCEGEGGEGRREGGGKKRMDEMTAKVMF